MLRRRVLVAGVLSALLLASAPPASAHRVRYETTLKRTGYVTTGPNVTRISGRVRSRNARCEPGRSIQIYYGSTAFGFATTDADGLWAVDGSAPKPNDFVISVYAEYLGNSDAHRHICSKDVITERLT